MNTERKLAHRVSRREMIYVGWLGGVGLTLGDLLHLNASQASRQTNDTSKSFGAAKSVIHIYLQGGFSQTDSFDPKPDAPAEYRGILEPVSTSLPSVHFSSHMAETAKIANKITVVRSMTHTEVDHSRGEHSMFTGYRPSPALVYPSIGSVVSHELGPRKAMPPYVCLPSQGSQFLGSGYLTNACGPFSLGADPARSNFSVRDLSLPKGIEDQRFEKRKEWKRLVDQHFASHANDDSIATMNSFYQRAYDLLSSKEARNAFRLDGETSEIRDLYGMNPWGPVLRPSAGARLLLARRLVEAGARFVTVTYGAWDTHAFHYRGIETQLPDFDRAFAGLIRDLDQRGLLEETLVLVTSEFGRTPKINAGGGRDHWPRVFSIVLAGGGVKQGTVFGSSDSLAAEPLDKPLSVENYFATIYHLLGINSQKDLMSPGDRPQAIVMNGQIERELIV